MTRKLTEEEAIAHFHAGCVVNETTGCIEWQRGLFNNGYGSFWYQGKIVRTHRFSFEIHHGRPIAEGMFLLHSCDNPKCVTPAHLREGTAQENMNDKVSKNRQAKGESHGRAKLTETQVAEIREKYETIEKCTQKALATEYVVSQRAIFRIVHNISWTHV